MTVSRATALKGAAGPLPLGSEEDGEKEEGWGGEGSGKELKGEGVTEREGVRGEATTDQRLLVSGLYLYYSLSFLYLPGSCIQSS